MWPSGKASDCKSGNRWFESSHVLKNLMIDGVMEAYRQVKPEIRGSIPGRSFNIVIVVTRPDAKLGRSRCNSEG